MIIYLAILMHKAPAALGFGTFLFHEGLHGYHLAKYLFVIYLILIDY